jgi:hypothetical protein
MKTPTSPSLAFAAVLALAAACPSAFAEETTSDGRIIVSPDSSAPLLPNMCVAGSEGCTPAASPRTARAVAPDALDPTTEAVLVEMGAPNTPSKETGAAAAKAARALIASASLTTNSGRDAGTGDESGTDYSGIGSKIINPNAGAAAARLEAAQPAAFVRLEPSAGPARIDASAQPRTFTKASGFSYVRSQKIEAATGERGTGFGTLVNDFKSGVSDPKLKGANEDLTPGGTRASSNGD